FGTRALRLQTPAGDIALDGLAPASALRWRARLESAGGSPSSHAREARPPLATAALVAARSLPTAALVALAPLAVALWFLVLGDIRPESVGDFGLVTSLPFGAWVALGALVSGFVASLAPERPRLRVAALYVVALIVALYGAVAIIEHAPSYNVTWRHAGIAGAIAASGHIDPTVDAYFDWPGFFALL